MPTAAPAAIAPPSARSPAVAETDYIPHHIWSQYFTSTANPTHARPTSTKAIGYTTVPGTKKVDPANHNYDLQDFFTAVGSGNYPAVSFIKMPSVYRTVTRATPIRSTSRPDWLT